jgi:4-hydroxyphenylacetate 3-monooxygenase
MNRVEDFLNSLRDGRNVWLAGNRIDVLKHEAFEGVIQNISNLFHMLDDPDDQESIGYPSPLTGEFVHLSFLVPQSIRDLAKRRKAFRVWSEATDGMMSRLSDYARSRLTGWYAARDILSKYDPHFSDKISRYYALARDENRFISFVQRDVQINRAKQYEKEHFGQSGFLTITRKTQEGVYVSGAKMIATAAPYTQDFIVYPVAKLSQEQKGAANLLIVPAHSHGLHIVCRESFAKPLAEKHNYPLSSQYDEMDALLIFDEVFIPWEYVLIHENPEAIWEIKKNRHSNSLGYHQALVRLQTKLEFIAGLACKLAEAIGATRFLHVQDKLGELIIQQETIKGLILASELDGESLEQDLYLPRFSYIESARNLGTAFYPRGIEILQLIAAGGLIQLPARMEDFQSPISSLMNLYYGGAGVDAEKRTKLFKLAWDLIGTPFASRHELYERFYAGDPIRNRASEYLSYDREHLLNRIDKYLE